MLIMASIADAFFFMSSTRDTRIDFTSESSSYPKSEPSLPNSSAAVPRLR